MKILAVYLPQYHEIPENNEWWGEHFTEWVNLKNAKPCFKGHYQPRVPLNKNYYNLTDTSVMKWQAKIAKEHGLYGFIYYHYWFEEGLLLEKPAELMLNDKEVDMPFCFCWANHTWKREWASKSDKILRKMTYGDEKEWEKHFYYLLPFFKDERYICMEGKPLFIIYRPEDFDRFPEMLGLWQKLALENGLPGICFAHQNTIYELYKEDNSPYTYGFEFQMNYAVKLYTAKSKIFAFQRIMNRVADKLPILRGKWSTMQYTYDDIWNIVLNTEPRHESWIPGAFVDWDNTPRRKNRGQLCTNVTPEKFKSYLSKQIIHAKESYHKDYMIMFAWNEWGESGYLEPDEKYGYGMLDALRDALIETNEFPEELKDYR